MAQVYFGKGIKVANGFDLGAHKPLDNRSVVATIADRDSMPSIQLYKGLIVFVEEESKYYVLVNHNAEYGDLVWEELGGSGNGSMVLPEFTVAGDSVEQATEENIGQIIYITEGSEAYPAGPYIVSGVGSVERLGTTTPSGDLSGDVATLKTDMATAKSDIEGLKGADTTLQNNINAEAQAREAADTELGGRIDTLSGVVNGKAAQGDVDALAGRMDTAEGEIDTLQSQVASLASATHFLGVKDSLDEVAEPKAGDIVIVGNKEYVYDSEKGWVELGDTTAEGQRIDALETAVGNAESGLVHDVAANASAISLLEPRVKVNEDALNAQIVGSVANKVASLEVVVGGAESGLVKDVADLKAADSTMAGDISALSGRVDALEAVEHPTKAQVEALEGNVTTLGSDLTTLSGRVDALEAVEHPTKAQVEALETAVGAIKTKTVDTTASHGVALTLSTEGAVGVDVNIDTLASEVIAKHQVLTTDVKLGGNIGTDKNPDRYTTNDTVQGVLSSMNERIESIDADIQAALEGGVTGIEAGNGITVDSTTATKPVVSVKVATNSALTATADGLDIIWSTF